MASRGESSRTESPNQLPRPNKRRLYVAADVNGEQDDDDDDGDGPLLDDDECCQNIQFKSQLDRQIVDGTKASECNPIGWKVEGGKKGQRLIGTTRNPIIPISFEC